MRIHPAMVICLALSAFSAVARASQQQPDVFSSEAAAIRFVVPEHSQVYEREIFLDRPGEAPSSMLLIRVVPRGLTEEASLLKSKVSIEVERLSPEMSLDEWVSRSHVPYPDSEPGAVSRVFVDGLPGLRRESQDSEGVPWAEVLVSNGGRGYRFSARGGANEATLQAVLESVRFEAGDTPLPSAVPADIAAQAAAEVRMVYLVPSDRSVNYNYRFGMEKAVREMQTGYYDRIGQGKAYRMHAPRVEVLHTPNPVVWYTTNAPGTYGSRFWEGVLADGFALTGGGFNDPSNRWIFYIDADQLCNQAVGGTSGVALLPANDLRGLTCGTNIPPCGGPPDNGGLCRWVGGFAHEMGHAFLLPHPPGCPLACSCPAPDTGCAKALMWLGYAVYPDAYFLASDVTSLLTNTSQFFPTLNPGYLPFWCGGGGCAVAPMAMAVDAAGDRVLQPNEGAVAVAPTWKNFSTTPISSLTGSLAGFTGPAGATYAISDAGASYGALAAGASAGCGSNCFAVSITASGRPATHWDTTAVEQVSTSSMATTWTLHVGNSFTDVPPSNGYYRFVETLLHNNVTAGCSATTYCPTTSTTRQQMAVFVLVAKHGVGYKPPLCSTPMFADVPASSPYCRWIEEAARRGAVSGCGGGNYCPSSLLTREVMSQFVLRILDPALNPPACTTPPFSDVPTSSPYCRWITELVNRGVVSGCGGGKYCPLSPVTRGQMAVFISVAFGLTLYGP
jgi:hypothetical protein